MTIDYEIAHVHAKNHEMVEVSWIMCFIDGRVRAIVSEVPMDEPREETPKHLNDPRLPKRPQFSCATLSNSVARDLIAKARRTACNKAHTRVKQENFVDYLQIRSSDEKIDICDRAGR